MLPKLLCPSFQLPPTSISFFQISTGSSGHRCWVLTAQPTAISLVSYIHHRILSSSQFSINIHSIPATGLPFTSMPLSLFDLSLYWADMLPPGSFQQSILESKPRTPKSDSTTFLPHSLSLLIHKSDKCPTPISSSSHLALSNALPYLFFYLYILQPCITHTSPRLIVPSLRLLLFVHASLLGCFSHFLQILASP